MGEAKRKREQAARPDWPRDESFRGVVELRQLMGVPALNGARSRELTGDPTSGPPISQADGGAPAEAIDLDVELLRCTLDAEMAEEDS